MYEYHFVEAPLWSFKTLKTYALEFADFLIRNKIDHSKGGALKLVYYLISFGCRRLFFLLSSKIFPNGKPH